MKKDFELLKGMIGVCAIVGEFLMIAGGISGAIMTAMNIIFGYMSSVTTVCGTILVFSAVVGVVFEILADGLAYYTANEYPEEVEETCNESK